MIMEVMTPSPPAEFNFDSASTSPFISAPGSPQPFGNLFYSAPTSPTRAGVSAFYTDFDHFSAGCDSPTVISIAQDRKSGDDDGDFEFNFGAPIDNTSLPVSADELFHAGQIKPFEPSSSKLLSVQGTQKETETEHLYHKETTGRGGERNYKGSRSLPTFRISDMLLENGNEKTPGNGQSKWGWRGWRLKDILLFRSASHGRVMEKHPLKRYELLNKASEEDVAVKVSSCRSSESKGGPPMSAHEIHYTANRAASEEKKRRTFLPYKQTLLGGCLGFTPPLHDRNSASFGSSTRGR